VQRQHWVHRIIGERGLKSVAKAVVSLAAAIFEERIGYRSRSTKRAAKPSEFVKPLRLRMDRCPLPTVSLANSVKKNGLSLR
jgi:hypothetical protein